MPGKHIPSLESERLKLVPFSWINHKKIIEDVLSNDPSMFMHSKSEIVRAAKTWYGVNRENYDNLELGFWVSTLKKTNTAIGYAGFLPIKENSHGLEVGVSLLKNYWNRGYAAEALQTCINYAITKKYSTFLAFIMPYNDAAKRVIKKLGFSFDGKEIHQGVPTEKYSFKINN